MANRATAAVRPVSRAKSSHINPSISHPAAQCQAVRNRQRQRRQCRRPASADGIAAALMLTADKPRIAPPALGGYDIHAVDGFRVDFSVRIIGDSFNVGS